MNYHKIKMKNFLKKVANKNGIPFQGVVIIGNNGSSTNTQVGVYSDGAILNQTPKRKIWPSDGRSWDCTWKESFMKARHQFIGEVTMMSKGEICKLMGIKKLDNVRPGWMNGQRSYKTTPIGPVLYLTIDTDVTYWNACLKEGMIDKRTELPDYMIDELVA
jgi:hypothetical protein